MHNNNLARRRYIINITLNRNPSILFVFDRGRVTNSACKECVLLWRSLKTKRRRHTYILFYYYYCYYTGRSLNLALWKRRESIWNLTYDARISGCSQFPFVRFIYLGIRIRQGVKSRYTFRGGRYTRQYASGTRGKKLEINIFTRVLKPSVYEPRVIIIIIYV